MTDDVPWPALDDVSRGATRGNQGSKGELGPPDDSGCAILQLRVQPGVFAVRLNRQCTVQYANLHSDVQAALRFSKTYWRKARRRQGYDKRADQDHMELHEWLQQLKDRCMAHIDLLVQRGDIKGPPYHMDDDFGFPFMREYVERRAAGVPHNPRLRDTPREGQRSRQPTLEEESDVSDGRTSTEPSDAEDPSHWPHRTGHDGQSGSSAGSPSWSRVTSDYTSLQNNLNSIVAQIELTNRILQQARARAATARQFAKDDLARFNFSFGSSYRAEQEVQRIQEKMNELIHNMVILTGSPQSPERFSAPAPPPPPAALVGAPDLQQYPPRHESRQASGEHEYRHPVSHELQIPYAHGSDTSNPPYPRVECPHEVQRQDDLNDMIPNLRASASWSDSPYSIALGDVRRDLFMAPLIELSDQSQVYTEGPGINGTSWIPGYLEQALVERARSMGEHAWDRNVPEEQQAMGPRVVDIPVYTGATDVRPPLTQTFAHSSSYPYRPPDSVSSPATSYYPHTRHL